MHLKTSRERISPVLFEEACLEAKGGLYARWKTDENVPILHFVNITGYQRVLIRRIDSAISRLWANVFNTPEPFLECIGTELTQINVRAHCRWWFAYWARYTTTPDDTTP